MNALPVIGGDFVVLVERMRQAQSDYFKTRNASALKESKRLEHLVDAMIGGWRRETAKLEKWGNGHKTDELRGVYDVTLKG